MNRVLNRQLVQAALARGGALPASVAAAITGRATAPAELVASGLWSEVLPDVLAAAPSIPTLELRQSAALAWIPEAALSHFDAARFEGIWVPDSDEVWITATIRVGGRRQPGVRLVRTRQMPSDIRTNGHLRWTPPARTVVDLATHLTRKQLESVLLSAVRRDKATAAEVAAAAAPIARRPGLSVLFEVTGLWTPERQSLLEDGMHRDAVSVIPYGVTRQHEVRQRNGSLLAALDVAVPELRLGFEADGLLFHSTDEQIAADQARDRALMALGWQIVRFREGVLDDHAYVCREIRALYEARMRRSAA